MRPRAAHPVDLQPGIRYVRRRPPLAAMYVDIVVIASPCGPFHSFPYFPRQRLRSNRYPVLNGDWKICPSRAAFKFRAKRTGVF